MPRVQYSNPPKGHNIVKRMDTPTKVGSLSAWFSKACKTIPEIPKGWYYSALSVTEKTIVFELIEPKTHERCAVVIARRDT